MKHTHLKNIRNGIINYGVPIIASISIAGFFVFSMVIALTRSIDDSPKTQRNLALEETLFIQKILIQQQIEADTKEIIRIEVEKYKENNCTQTGIIVGTEIEYTCGTVEMMAIEAMLPGR